MESLSPAQPVSRTACHLLNLLYGKPISCSTCLEDSLPRLNLLYGKPVSCSAYLKDSLPPAQPALWKACLLLNLPREQPVSCSTCFMESLSPALPAS
jgi:hypothetical protein